MRMSDTQLPPGRILPNYGPNQAVKGRLEPKDCSGKKLTNVFLHLISGPKL